MRRNPLVPAIAVFLIAAFCAATLLAQQKTAPPKKPPAEKVTVTGTVAVVKDAKGNVTGGVIKTPDKGEYLFNSKKGKGKDLVQLADKKVEVTGTVREGKSGKKVIAVSEFREAK